MYQMAQCRKPQGLKTEKVGTKQGTDTESAATLPCMMLGPMGHQGGYIRELNL